jgi:hypothetical protein
VEIALREAALGHPPKTLTLREGDHLPDVAGPAAA